MSNFKESSKYTWINHKIHILSKQINNKENKDLPSLKPGFSIKLCHERQGAGNSMMIH